MATITTDLICNLNQPVAATFLHGNLFSQDNAGNTINVYVLDNGAPATIGGTVSANVIRADGNTVAVSGAIDGNKAYVILPQACYAVPGRVEIIIKLTQNTTITTIAAIVANVYRSTTDTVVDPGTIIPSISSLIAQIEAAVDSIPVDYSGLLATIAADYSSSKTYQVGQYAWQGGVLKRCIVPITTAETYTAAHWTNAVIGDDLSALKSAIQLTADGSESIDISGFSSISCVVSDSNTLTRSAAKYRSRQFAPGELWKKISITANPDFNTHVTFVTEALPTTPTSGTDMSSALCTGETGRHVVTKGTTETVAIPSDCAYIVIAYTSNGNDATPSSVVVYTEMGGEMEGKQDSLTFDNEPIPASANPVKSGGVYKTMEKVANFANGGILGSTGLKAIKFEPGMIETPDTGETASLTRVPSQTGKYSAYASVTEGQDVYIKTSAGSTSYRGWCFTKANMQVTRRAATNAYETILTAEADEAYVIVNSNPDDDDCYLLIGQDTQNDKLDKVAKEIISEIRQIQSLVNITLNPIVGVFESGIIRTPAVGQTTSLTRETSATGRVSAYLPVTPGQKAYISAGKGTSTVRGYAFLDENLTVISRATSAAGVYDLTVPDNSAYVVVNSLSDADPYLIIVENTQDTMEDSLNVGMFNRIASCGYSWDSGYAYSNRSGESHSYTRRSRSWVAVLANMMGIDYACYGVPSGTTCAPGSEWIGEDGAKCWQTETHGLVTLLAEEPCDLYWFHLFGNDYKKLGSTYLGTIEDINDDYTQNPDTFYGNYGRIMAQIKEHAPYAKFIFSYREKNNSTATCKAFAAAVREIAEYYGVPTINWYDDPWFANWMDNHLFSSHPTFADYAGMGKAADRLFAKCAKNYWQYFKDFVPAADT